MKKVIAVSLLLLSSLAARAVEDTQVEYIGGTVQTIPAGAVGHLDISSGTILSFQYAGGTLAIPYNTIRSYEYTQEVAHHLGVAPAIAVGLVKKRQRRHFFRISYQDQTNVAQVLVLEVSKQMPTTLLAVLQVRAPQGCKPSGPCARRYY
jgi:hypothetical protein